MIKLLQDLKKLPNTVFLLWVILIITSLMLKFWMWYFIPEQPFGPDASDYFYIAQLITKHQLEYPFITHPYGLWRLPALPILISLLGDSYHNLMIFQLLLSYLIGYLVYKIFDKLTQESTISIFIGTFTLFLPYINIAACQILTELLQTLLIIYFLKKIFYKEYDWRFSLAMSIMVFLRPEGYFYIVFLLLRTLYLKYFREVLVFVVPLLLMIGWMTKNKQVYDTFSMVNPVMSSRALIGGIYPQINTKESHLFHQKFNFYEARDYPSSRKFVQKYKEQVRKELIDYLQNRPFSYLLYRFNSILYGFSYITFNGEIMPDENWTYQRKATYQQVSDNNASWGYHSILTNRDWLRLSLRIFYNGSLMFLNFTGLFFILYNFRKLRVFLFIFFLFSYLSVVEVDMRYFMTIHLLCNCFFVLGIRNMFLYKSLRLKL